MNYLKSKTVLFGSILAVLGGLQAALPDLQAFLSPAVYGYVTSAIGVIVIILRSVTSVPLEDK